MSHTKIILIIDDDVDDIAFFCEALSEIDDSIKCLGARGGEEAIKLLSSNPTLIPDYIYLDLNMPKMDGKQCLKHIKGDDVLCSIPVIIYTTSKAKEEIEETKSLGALWFLTKPSKFSDLKKAINSIFDEKWETVNGLN